MTSRLLPLRVARAAVGCVLALALLASAGDASAKVSWTGIGPARLGMSEAQLRAKLGKPSYSTTREQASGERRQVFRRRKLEVILANDRAISIRTTSRRQLAPGGIRIGMTFARVRRELGTRRCTTRERRVCALYRGAANMDFVFHRRRLRMISVSAP